MTQQPQQLKFGDRVRCKQTGAEGLIIDTGKTAGRAAGHRRGVCILALPLTARNQEISGGFMDLIK